MENKTELDCAARLWEFYLFIVDVFIETAVSRLFFSD
jgi:hypothetical protein